MILEDLGYTTSFEKYREEQALTQFSVGRVVSEHKDRYVVRSENGDFDSELIGNLRFTAEDRHDFPAVGDWVAFSEFDEDKALIHHIYPRKSIIERQAVGKFGQKQIIASNIDYGLIVQAVDNNFNVNRLERYLTICNTSKVKPIIILNKIDLIDESQLNTILSKISERIKHVQIIATSNQTLAGHKELKSIIITGKTYCLLGSSGVGKSTLLNNISGKELMKTGSISIKFGKGKHVTSHRELIILENGGILIDNPGMRELGIADSTDGLEITFDEIIEMSSRCKFKDCTHINEMGCAILEAIENEDLDIGLYNNYQKMIREKTHFESTIMEKRKKDKDFGKMIKNHKKARKHHKY
ncbi:MAG: ribosome small subunit-dependent GTPase A [Candidatus Marinimicrobia bacterium]|jgi:ribosome biogenesis GTPase|nr:ribosome small subunit-dependent GTPase A [Candidatus Neomarinimicrobiota bacterium]MBT3633755.1 ribosome small subunit-dependent GTPase A [Candidatus Neomarinimicrobiota bacterium]MBT3682547.1 ribosome small subunit-dependent GTPase A [Candidatus Neomarinimicrobiota bacterium]MBT3759311.1 ribosome small subunit-dependent GTPase A [Candidatus Neomarinimicrobiota bacterium]MBT3894681.1 ribosome small subunit-dependent GTPase A [Candidatus Neomarinimicrobiota bacterium]